MPITRRDYFKPIQIGGCLLWLDGADSTTITGTSPVTNWRDKSTSACSVFSSGGSPTYTRTTALSLGCVSFNGSTDYLTIGNFTDLQPNTMFIIATLNSLSTSASYAFIAQSDDSGYPADGLGAAFFYYASGGTPYLMPWAGITGATTNPPLYFSAGATYIYSVLFNGASSGVGYNGNFTSGVNPGTVGWKNLRLGANWPLNAFQSINVAEVIFYSSALSTTQRQQVEAYLAQKWGLTGSLPPGHPGLTSVFYRPVANKLANLPYYTQFSPKTIQNCQLWLDAADLTSMTIASGSISQWNDKSGNGYSFVNNATFTPWNFGSIYYPTITYSGLNKQNIVSFNTQSLGSVDIFPSGNAQSFSMFLVGTSYMGRGEDGYGSGWSISFPDFIGSIVFVGSGAVGYTMTNGTGLLNYLEVTQGSTSVITTYNSGSLVQTQSPVNNTLRSSTIGFQIGRRSGYYRNGYIAEILVYSRVLSSGERQTVESYLAQKWGLTAALPAGNINNTFPAGSPVGLQAYISRVVTTLDDIIYLPGIPIIATPTNTGNLTTLTMTWTAPSVVGTAGIVSGYIVYILANGSLVAGTGIGTGGTQTLGNVLTASYTPMTTNLNYSYYVAASGPGGRGAVSSTSATTIYYATPGTPTVNTPTNAGNATTLTMTWNAPSGTVTYYTVYVLGNGSAVTTLTPGNSLTTTYSPMTTNVAYSFYVTATNTIAGATSGNSATSATATYYAAPGTPTVNTPTNAGNATTLTMTWNAPSGIVTYYTVYVLGNGSAVTTLTPGNSLTTTYSPMTTNVAYSFYVTATNTIAGATSGNSTTSATAIYYATPGTPTVNTPTNTGSTLNMTWNAPSGTVTSYTVFVLASGSLTATLTPGLVLSTTFSPMTSSVPYSFNVRATNGTVNGGTSLTSATVTFTGPPATPTSLTIDRIGVTFANFTVGAVTNATSYTVSVYSVATRTNTGGSLVTTGTSGTTSISIPFNFVSYFGAGFYYATVTASSSSGTSSAFTCPNIVTMLGYTGANQTWTSPFSGSVTICLCGGGAAGTQSGSGGSGGLVVATYTIANGTVYTVAVGGGALGGNSHGLPPYTQLLAGAWGGIGGVASGGGGLSPGGGMSQFQNPGPTAYIMAGGGGGGGNSSSLCTDGNGGNGGDGGGTSGTAGGTANPGAGTQSSPGGGGTASAGGAGGAGGAGAAGTAGSVGTGTNGGAGGAGGAGTFQRGSGGGGGYRGGGGGGGLNGVGATGGGGAGSSFTTGVTLVASVVGGAVNGISDVRFATQGFNGSCAIIY